MNRGYYEHRSQLRSFLNHSVALTQDIPYLVSFIVVVMLISTIIHVPNDLHERSTNLRRREAAIVGLCPLSHHVIDFFLYRAS